MTLGSDYLQLKHNIVEVPVLLKASFGQPNLRFFINAGPVLTYTLGGEVSVHEGGFTLKTGPGSVLLEARYSCLFSSNDVGVKLNPQNV